MDPLRPRDDLTTLTLTELRALADALERRRPGAPVPSVGVRPRRTPWTYRDIWRLRDVREELRRRGHER